jgi:hypothetical protein
LCALSLAACGGSKGGSLEDAGMDAGDGGGGKAGHGGSGGSGGQAGSSSSIGLGDGGILPMMMLMCTEAPPTGPVTCGGQTCMPPMFGMNPCIVPCCVSVNGHETCASKSTAMGFSTECTMPGTPDPSCPDLSAGGGLGGLGAGLGGGMTTTPADGGMAAGGMGMAFKGCCNAGTHTCGFISTLRPGCITQSSVVMVPNPPQACTGASEDGGTDAGH